MEEFKDELPETTRCENFYGKQSAKHWIVTQKDLDAMYKTGKVSFCCWQMLVLCPQMERQ